MKPLFHKMEQISSSSLGKKDKKTINKAFCKEILKKTEDYNVIKFKNRTSLVVEKKFALLFFFNNKYFPTIKFLEQESYEIDTIFLDEGAILPIQRGANVMAPGIYKYIDRVIGDFKKGDVVAVKIIDKGIIAIGEALISKKDISSTTNGEAIMVVHSSSDDLYKLF